MHRMDAKVYRTMMMDHSIEVSIDVIDLHLENNSPNYNMPHSFDKGGIELDRFGVASVETVFRIGSSSLNCLLRLSKKKT
mmetsp:Transcript_31757/g.63323  ORF Transcript_31757/g.63323 Transcript_31757/m.63323 type:complete len:80 (+) Transcript_31757:182-421(+)